MQIVYTIALLWLTYYVFSQECLFSVQALVATPFLLHGFYAVIKNNGFYNILKIIFSRFLPKKSLRGQHVFVTGAGSGIGKSMAIKLSKLGCKVTLADINFEAVSKVQQQIADGKQTFAVKCDVSSYENVKQAAQASIEALGSVDILINNAGIVSGRKILQNSEQMIQKTIDVNTVSHHWTVRAFLPGMLQRDRGHIITVASVAGTVGVNGLVDYCASKFGAVGFDESLRMELNSLKSNVRTTCICPYYIDTGMFEGVQSKFGFFLPILKEDFVSSRIIQAIQQDEQVVLLPWFCNVSSFCKSIMPVSLFDWTMDLFGANKSMDHFTGRKH